MGQKKKINILSPVDNHLEAKLLIEEGVDELYGGYFPSYFSDYSYFLSPNQRTFKEAQMDKDELRKVIDICKSYGIPFYLTINQLYFKKSQLPLILKMAEEAVQMGVSAFIAGSIPIILHLKHNFSSIPIHISTMANVTNHYAALFYKTLGIKRITLPRGLLINEIRNIIKNSEDLEFDIFILIGKCPNVEGFCSFLHTNPHKIWPCEQYYNIKGDPEASEVQKNWQGFYRSQSCGVCGLTKLINMNIKSLKIVGRGSPTRFKLDNLKMIKEALNIVTGTKSPGLKIKLLKELYKRRFQHPCNPFCCYFPQEALS